MDLSHVLLVSGTIQVYVCYADSGPRGFGLSIFASVLQEIFYFKPQTIYVSSVFLCVIAYVLGDTMARVLPSKGVIGSYLNPHPFNMKEHAYVMW
jgi:hypothetical protein